MESTPAVCGIVGGMEQRLPPQDGDADLVERARRGDRAAFDELVEAHLPLVWRVVFRIVRRHEDAEDVAQEVFLTAWRTLAGFRGEARFSTWLHQIAVTRALNYLDRSAEKISRAAQPLAPWGAEESPDADPGPAWTARRDAASPLAALEAQELRRRLAECLEKLPGVWRGALALRDGEDMSYEDIARTTGTVVGTVRSRLARARLALRRCIEGADA